LKKGRKKSGTTTDSIIPPQKISMFFSKTEFFFDPGFSVIDAVIVKRGKEDYVLVLKDNTRPFRNIKVAFGKSVVDPYHNV
jgi:hypothetical protein